MIKITTDSTCDLPRELLERYNITVTPLGIIKAGKLYQDGVDIRTGDIAAHVDAGGEITTTNAVNVADYEELFRRLMEEYDAVIHLNIGMGFSSCHQNARLAAEEVDGVYVVDSANLTVGHGMLVLAAAEAAEAGKSVTEILAMLEEMIPRVETSFVLDRLDYMKKGGRCSTATALGASLLKLHPCLDVVDGKLPVTKKYRGSIEKVVEEYVRDRLRDRTDLDTPGLSGGHLPGRPPGLHRPGGPASGRAVPGDHRGQGGVHHLLPLRPRHPGRDLPAEGVRPCALRAAGPAARFPRPGIKQKSRPLWGPALFAGNQIYLTAMASISQSTPLGSSRTATQLRAGLEVKYLAYTSLKAAKSPMSARKQVVFTTLSRVTPAASRMAPTFLQLCSACAAMPSGIAPVAGSTGIWPEVMTRSPKA